MARPARSEELQLAHAHLRLGSLALARTELETLAGLDKLDPPGLVDLAEVRWRTGDLAGAGEAAGAALRGDEEFTVALLIAAEAASAVGRPNEARRLALRAMAGATGSVDVLFAGMPRSAVWPADADEPPPTAPTLFDRSPEPARTAQGRRPMADDSNPARTPMPPPTVNPVTLGFWDEDAAPETETDEDLPDPAHELEAGRAALVAGRLDEAALRFAIALRLAPAIAPAILEATAGARVAGLMIVRGDAYRLAGHESEAREAYLVAAHGGLPERRRRARSQSSKDRPIGSPSVDASAGDDADATDGGGSDAVPEGTIDPILDDPPA